MEKVNGLGIASLVLGIVGVLLACLGIGAVFGLIGVILGILGLTVIKDAKKGIAIAGTIVSGVALLIGVGLFITGFGLGLLSDSKNDSGTSGKKDSFASTFMGTSTSEEAEDEGDGSYENNGAFDILERASYKNSIGTTIIVHKVKGKKDVSVSATMLAYDAGGNVIGKSTDDIVLTKGENNYFLYRFDGDVSNAKFEVTASTKSDSIMTGTRSAVVMDSYNKSGDDLYLTLKQVGDSIGSFARFKLLFYKGGTIVHTEDGYFSIYAEGLTGKGTTDVAKVWVYGVDYDKVEFIYEP